MGIATATGALPVPSASPPVLGSRLPKVSLQVPGLVVLYRNHAVVSAPVWIDRRAEGGRGVRHVGRRHGDHGRRRRRGGEGQDRAEARTDAALCDGAEVVSGRWCEPREWIGHRRSGGAG